MQIKKRELLRKSWLFPILLSILYFITAYLSRRYLLILPENFTISWPPSGIGAACFILIPFTNWPLALLSFGAANIAGNILSGAGILQSFGYASAELAHYLAGAYIYKNLTGGIVNFSRLKEIPLFILFPGILGSAISAGIGSFFSILHTPELLFFNTFVMWFVSSMVGVLTVSPFILAFSVSEPLKKTFHKKSVYEASLLLFLLLSTTFFVFGMNPEFHPYVFPLMFLSFSFIIWGGIRFKQYGASFTAMVFSLIVVFLSANKSGPIMMIHGPIQQRIIWFQVYLSVITISGLIVGVLQQEQEKQKERLSFIRNRLEKLITNTDEIVFTLTKELQFSFLSPSWIVHTGYKFKDLLGKRILNFIHEDDQLGFTEYFNSTLHKTHNKKHIEFRFRKSDNTWLWLRTSGAHISDSARSDYYVAMAQDITSKVKLEYELRNSIKEKNVLLKEVHHRVKNNLQIIQSLLRLQKSQLKDERDKELFNDSEQRIRSMSLVHEKLYSQDSYDKINFADYIKSLINEIKSAFGIKDSSITFDVTGVLPLPMTIDKTIPCGLIIQEVISNSLKHAFDGIEDGRITIRFYPQDNYTNVLSLADNGIGMQYNDEQTPNGLGTRLISALAKQLNGELDLKSNEKGVSYTIKFPK
ncbi:MAG: MASE1 domain-containing protein [Spirochaetia bacterium]